MTWSAYPDKDDQGDTQIRPKFGFHGSGIIIFPLKKDYSCVIEGGFSQRGRKVRFANGTIENNSSHQFFDASMLLRRAFKFQLADNIPADWFVNIGPHISYWIGGKGTIGPVDSDGSPYKIQFADTLDLSDFETMYLIDANRWLFGIDIGVGMDAPLGRGKKINAELRFTWGHTFFGQRTTANYSWVDFTDNNLRANERILTIAVAYIFDVDLKERKKGRSTKDKEVNRKPGRKRRN
jgi:hypothetical protein